MENRLMVVLYTICLKCVKITIHFTFTLWTMNDNRINQKQVAFTMESFFLFAPNGRHWDATIFLIDIKLQLQKTFLLTSVWKSNNHQSTAMHVERRKGRALQTDDKIQATIIVIANLRWKKNYMKKKIL